MQECTNAPMQECREMTSPPDPRSLKARGNIYPPSSVIRHPFPPRRDLRYAPSSAICQWLALYTKSRQEKVVMQRLLEEGIEAYVPLHKVIRQWSDRKKLVEEPLIRSYCFVNVAPFRQHKVLGVPGAVRYVWFSGKPAAIPAKQIDLLKIITGYNIPVECLSGNLMPGTKVKIIAGPMAGYCGEMISGSGKSRVIIRIEPLETAISISISPALLERIRN